MDDQESRSKMAMVVAGSFICGSLVLILSLFLQEAVSGFTRFSSVAYIVPIIFGGVAGTLLGLKLHKVGTLNEVLAARNKELEVAVAGILPICSHCKAIREPGKDPKDKKSWHPVEDYLSQNTTSRFTHSICPNCVQEMYPDIYASKYSGSDSEK